MLRACLDTSQNTALPQPCESLPFSLQCNNVTDNDDNNSDFFSGTLSQIITSIFQFSL